MKNKFNIDDLVEVKYNGIRLFVKEFEYNLAVGCFVYSLGLIDNPNSFYSAIEHSLIGVNTTKPIETSKENGC